MTTDGDMWLVYVDPADESVHFQHWRDVPEVGSLINEAGDDMDLVGWTLDPSTGEQ